MTIFALLSWIVLGAVIGAVLSLIWKTRSLTLAWGVAAGGVGGVVGGLIGRIVLPGTVSELPPLAIAVLGAVLAMFIARARVRRDLPRTA